MKSLTKCFRPHRGMEDRGTVDNIKASGALCHALIAARKSHIGVKLPFLELHIEDKMHSLGEGE